MTITTIEEAIAEIEGRRLRLDALDITPVSFDFGEGYPESWDYAEAVRCDDCEQAIVGPDDHWLIAQDEEGDDVNTFRDDGTVGLWLIDPEYADDEAFAEVEPRECENAGRDSRDMDAEGPMMNYFYPVDIDDLADAARALVDSPLVPVEIGRQTGLALSGGGMDFSWEICEAFVLLGMLPPVHFARLPRQCNYASETNLLTAAACLRSIEIQRAQLQRTEEDLRLTVADLRPTEDVA